MRTKSSFKVDRERIQLLTETISDQLAVAEFSVNVEFVDLKEISELNSRFRGIEHPTDVLSFPQNDWHRQLLVGDHTSPQQSNNNHFPCKTLGDIIISPEKAQKNAISIGQPLDREICFLLVHGMLHLCGHDHQYPDEEKIMKQQQKILMKTLNGSDSRPPLWQNCLWVEN